MLKVQMTVYSHNIVHCHMVVNVHLTEHPPFPLP